MKTITNFLFLIFLSFSINGQAVFQNVAEFEGIFSHIYSKNPRIYIDYETDGSTFANYGIYPNANPCILDVKYRLGGGSNVWTEVNTKDVFMFICLAADQDQTKSSNLITNEFSTLKRLDQVNIYHQKKSLTRAQEVSNKNEIKIDPSSLSTAFPNAIRVDDVGNYSISMSSMMNILFSAAKEQQVMLKEKISAKDKEIQDLRNQFKSLKEELNSFKLEYALKKK